MHNNTSAIFPQSTFWKRELLQQELSGPTIVIVFIISLSNITALWRLSPTQRFCSYYRLGPTFRVWMFRQETS